MNLPWKFYSYGQARKSLWIETYIVQRQTGPSEGQARKSLWIETFFVMTIDRQP